MFTIPIRRDLTQFIFSEKNYVDATWCTIGTSKYVAKKKKTIIVRNTNLVWCLVDSLFCLSKLLLLVLPWWIPPFPPHSSVDHGQYAGHRPELYASPETVRVALRTLNPIILLPVTLRITNAESEIIATLEVKYRTSCTNFTHRIA